MLSQQTDDHGPIGHASQLENPNSIRTFQHTVHVEEGRHSFCAFSPGL